MISLSSTLVVGIYTGGILEKKISPDNMASEALIEIFDNILDSYEISRIIYTNGPGSFMGIKVSYTILKTISIVKDIKFYAVSGFELNGGGPIKANKTMSFVLNNGEILLKKALPVEFKLPTNLNTLNLENDTLPNYILGAV
ncbi:N6-L-threonylcarbamoyladenine synthase, TsaB subunit [Campylobacter corcagiensis]|nr:N6-L-threonylcarbamoyladenine synthase, TsaB subunit [Campylobacter corcagiensis]